MNHQQTTHRNGEKSIDIPCALNTMFFCSYYVPSTSIFLSHHYVFRSENGCGISMTKIYSILFPKLFRPTCSSDLSRSQFIQTVKGQYSFSKKNAYFNLFLEVFQIWYIRKITIQVAKTNKICKSTGKIRKQFFVQVSYFSFVIQHMR